MLINSAIVKAAVAFVLGASSLGHLVATHAPRASATAEPRYHQCPSIYRRYDQYLLAKPSVPCWLARTVEVAQPYGGQWLDNWRWNEVQTQDRTGRWHLSFWRQGMDGYWPAVVVIKVPSA
jgi:hypothetical protein